MALELWGSQFCAKRILLHLDNKGVVFAINCLVSKSLPVIAILHHFVFKCVDLNIWLTAKFVPGVTNLIAESSDGQILDVSSECRSYWPVLSTPFVESDMNPVMLAIQSSLAPSIWVCYKAVWTFCRVIALRKVWCCNF